LVQEKGENVVKKFQKKQNEITHTCPFCHGSGRLKAGSLLASPIGGVVEGTIVCGDCNGAGRISDKKMAELEADVPAGWR
jgi:DnaJ-class molecular chaperone